MATAPTRTAGDIIDASLRLIGVLAADQTAPAADSSLGLEALAELIGAWGGEGLLVPTITSENFSLVVGQAAYVVGPGGADLDTKRPEKVLSVFITDTNVDYFCQIIGEGEYSILEDKGTAQARPTKVWINYGAPTVTMTFWKEPDATDTVNLTSVKSFTEPTSLTDTMVTTCGIPRNFHNAIKFNLAVELAPYFGQEIKPTVQLHANRLKLALINQTSKLRHEPIDPNYWARMLAIHGMNLGQ